MKRILIFASLLVLAWQSQACVVYKKLSTPDSLIMDEPTNFGFGANIDFNGDSNPECAFSWVWFGGFGWTIQPASIDTSMRYLIHATDTTAGGEKVLSALNAGTIVKTGNWSLSSQNPVIADSTAPGFSGLGDKYIGLKFTQNGKTHYGWILVSFHGTMPNPTLVVKEYAYESTPEMGITTGDTGVVITGITAYGKGGLTKVLKTATLQMEVTVNPSGNQNYFVHWSVNDTSKATISASGILMPKDTGKVIITAIDSCSGKTDDTTIQIYAFPANVETMNTDEKLRIYPNPVNDELHIETTGGIVYETALLYTIDGRLVENYSLMSSSSVIKMKELQTGLYYMVFLDAQTGERQMLRIIKR